jgi:SAM-dependent methyltransferase
MNSKLVDFFERRVFNGRSDLRVAELACGSGYASHLIALRDGVGLSVASDINRIYHQQAEIPDFAASFVLSDIFKPSFPPACFDLVWNSSSLEHFEDPSIPFQAMTRLVKPGGYVFVGVPYLFGPLAVYYLTPSASQREWLGKPFSYRALEKLFLDGGLEVQANLVYLARFFVGILGRKTG